MEKIPTIKQNYLNKKKFYTKEKPLSQRITKEN